MTTSTSVERRRLRARLALTLSTILCSGLAAPAFAATPHPNLDANGVDLTDGSFNPQLPIYSIGSGQAALALVVAPIPGDNTLDNWSNISMYQTVSGGVTRVVFSLGATFDTFTSADGFAASTRGTGATVNISGTSATYHTLEGVTITFYNPNPAGFGGGTTKFCNDSTTNSCSLLPSSISGKAGMDIAYNWDVTPNCTSPQVPDTDGNCDEYWRLRGVSNDAGYGITWGYVNETGPQVAAYFRKATATFSNANVSGTSPVATYGYPSSSVTTITSPGGKVWRITAPGAIIGIRRPSASSDTTTIAYSGGNVTSVTNDGVTTTYARSVSGSTATMVVTDAQSHTTTVVSDMTKFRPTSVTDALGRTTTMSYDGVGKLTEITYPEGNKRQVGYDAASRTTSVTQKAKPGSGLADIVTSTSYPADCDDATCASWSKDALGNQTDYTYDSVTGLLASVTAPAPTPGATRPQTRYSYTTVAGVAVATGVSTCRTGAAPACVGTADEVKTSVSYDANLLPTSVGSGAGDLSLTATTAATYDRAGNLLTVDGPLPGTDDTTTYRWSADREALGAISPDPDGAGPLKRRAVRTTYDATGRTSFVSSGTVTGTDDAAWANFAEASHRYIQYGANGQVDRQALWTGAAGDYAVADYLYDAVGRRVCSILYMSGTGLGPQAAACAPAQTSGAMGPDRVSRTTYDAAGQQVKTQSAYGTLDQSDDATVTYNANGTTETLTDANGNRTTYEYDGFDRLTSTRYPVAAAGAGTSSTTDFEQPHYDANGNIVSLHLRDGQMLHYAYDALNRLTLKDLPGSEPDVIYSYDLLGRAVSAASSAQTLTFGYDALGRTVAQGGPLGTVTSSYDLAGRRTQLTWPGSPAFSVSYGHLVTGEMTTVTDSGLTLLATYDYDDLGRRVSLVRGNPSSTRYGYDAASRLTSLGVDLAGTSSDLTLGFGYNPAGQIVSRTASNDAYAWTGSANRDDASAVNGLNQATSVGTAGLGYDARGNLSSNGGAGYAYSSENLLASGPSGATLSYDPLLRLSQVSGNGSATRRFVYDGQTMIAEHDAGGGLVRRYVPGAGVDEPIMESDAAGVRTWLYADERGSIVAQADDAGTKLAIDTYDEYGVPGSRNVGRFQYTGQKWLLELGLYDYKARMYAPGLGRFLQTDPIGYGDGMNWYGYVGGDPVNRRDPSGTCGFDQVRLVVPGHGPSTTNADGDIVVTANVICLNLHFDGGGFAFNTDGSFGGVSSSDGGGDAAPVPQRNTCPNVGYDTYGLGGSGTIALFLGVNVSVSIGVAIPKNGDLLNVQYFASGQGAAMLGIGGFAGVGATFSKGTTSGVMKNFDTDVFGYGETDTGLGFAVGGSAQGNRNSSSGSVGLPIPKVGAGYGAYAGVGFGGSATVASTPFCASGY